MTNSYCSSQSLVKFIDLGSALRFKELAAGNCKDNAKRMTEKDTRDQDQIANQDTDILLDDVFDTEEDLLMIQTQAFEGIYKKEYLSKVLSESWRDESIHQMSLRHEAELNELKKMHTQQKQELLDEMRRRKDKVRRIGERMRHVRKHRKEYNEGESISQLMEFESNSVRSKDVAFKSSFMITDDLLIDNLSRINVPHTSTEAEFNHRDDAELLTNPLLSSVHNFKSQIAAHNGIQGDIKAFSEHKPSLCNKEADMNENVIVDCEMNSLNQNADRIHSTCNPPSPILCSQIQERESIQKEQNSSRLKLEKMKILPLEFLNNQDQTDNKSLRLAKTQRTVERQKENTLGCSIIIRHEALSLKNLSSNLPNSSFKCDNLYEILEVVYI